MYQTVIFIERERSTSSSALFVSWDGLLISRIFVILGVPNQQFKIVFFPSLEPRFS